MIRMVKKTSDPLNFQFDNAYPLMDAIAMDRTIDGIRIRTELPNPRESPSQLMPVQASAHALTHGWKVTSIGGPNTLPSRISGMPLSEVTIITYSGNR